MIKDVEFDVLQRPSLELPKAKKTALTNAVTGGPFSFTNNAGDAVVNEIGGRKC